jgi:hypothetical protein
LYGDADLVVAEHCEAVKMKRGRESDERHDALLTFSGTPTGAATVFTMSSSPGFW